MHLMQIRGLQDIGRFDDPFAAAGRNENAEHRRVHRHQQGIGAVGAHRSEKLRQRIGNPCSNNHAKDNGIKRELDYYAAGGWNALGYGSHKALGAPVQQKPNRDEY